MTTRTQNKRSPSRDRDQQGRFSEERNEGNRQRYNEDYGRNYEVINEEDENWDDRDYETSRGPRSEFDNEYRGPRSEYDNDFEGDYDEDYNREEMEDRRSFRGAYDRDENYDEGYDERGYDEDEDYEQYGRRGGRGIASME